MPDVLTVYEILKDIDSEVNVFKKSLKLLEEYGYAAPVSAPTNRCIKEQMLGEDRFRYNSVVQRINSGQSLGDIAGRKINSDRSYSLKFKPRARRAYNRTVHDLSDITPAAERFEANSFLSWKEPEGAALWTTVVGYVLAGALYPEIQNNLTYVYGTGIALASAGASLGYLYGRLMRSGHAKQKLAEEVKYVGQRLGV